MNCIFEDRNDWDNGEGYYGTTTYKIYKCPVCKDITLIDHTISNAFEDDIDIKYPTDNVDYAKVPSNIKTAFEAAVKTKGIDTAICMQSLRRTLEMICKDKNAQGGDLRDKIKDLVDKKILPEMMNDACYIIRQNGNNAAHADDIQFSDYDVDQVIKLVAAIINYLYSMPYRIGQLKESLVKRNQERK
jgi:hypothetical protein